MLLFWFIVEIKREEKMIRPLSALLLWFVQAIYIKLIIALKKYIFKYEVRLSLQHT